MSGVYYKVLGDRQNSYHGGHGRWVKNRWRTVEGLLEPCWNGIHFCRADQLLSWLGPQVWVFEDGSPDETMDAGDKMVTRRGRVVERLDTWNERTARLFAADCAEAVLPIFERARPDNDGPRRAIEAARGFARGELGRDELAAARATAWDAAAAGAAAAGAAAARATAWPAAGAAAAGAAAVAAAWDAAVAAAAGAAAVAAARATAWGGVGAAAAGAAAAAAARAAARADQTALLLDYLEGRRTT